MLPSPGNTRGSASLAGMKELNNGKPLSPPTTIVNQSKPPSPWLVTEQRRGTAVSPTPTSFHANPHLFIGGEVRRPAVHSTGRRGDSNTSPFGSTCLVCVAFSRAKAKVSPRGALSPASESATCKPPKHNGRGLRVGAGLVFVFILEESFRSS